MPKKDEEGLYLLIPVDLKRAYQKILIDNKISMRQDIIAHIRDYIQKQG